MVDHDNNSPSSPIFSKLLTPTGIKFSDGSYYESHVDSRYFVYLGDADGNTQVYERTSQGYVTRFSATGWMSRLFALDQ